MRETGIVGTTAAPPELYMDADYAIHGGNDLMLSSTGGAHAEVTDKTSATSVDVLGFACTHECIAEVHCHARKSAFLRMHFSAFIAIWMHSMQAGACTSASPRPNSPARSAAPLPRG